MQVRSSKTALPTHHYGYATYHTQPNAFLTQPYVISDMFQPLRDMTSSET
jgi:hypothetical protein